MNRNRFVEAKHALILQRETWWTPATQPHYLILALGNQDSSWVMAFCPWLGIILSRSSTGSWCGPIFRRESLRFQRQASTTSVYKQFHRGVRFFQHMAHVTFTAFCVMVAMLLYLWQWKQVLVEQDDANVWRADRWDQQTVGLGQAEDLSNY